MQGRTAALVLVIEDDEDIQQLLRLLLEDNGFVVLLAGDGATALRMIEEHDPAVSLLDLGLPDIGGHDLLRRIRERTERPVIVLSGRADESDRVLALEFGADDYVVKPFLHNELVARVRTRVRRAPGVALSVPTAPDPTVSGLHVDPSGREVRLGGAVVELTAREFDLLAFLVAAPRRVFSREQLLASVWGSSAEWQDAATVTEHVHRLRRKIGGTYISTVRGIGYRFDPD